MTGLAARAALREERRRGMGLDVTAIGELLIDFAPVGESEDGFPVLDLIFQFLFHLNLKLFFY